MRFVIAFAGQGDAQQISVVLRLAMDIFQCRSEQEVHEKVDKLRWEGSA
jgi:hypothetical protein